jgi:hypothetical protein
MLQVKKALANLEPSTHGTNLPIWKVRAVSTVIERLFAPFVLALFHAPSLF